MRNGSELDLGPVIQRLNEAKILKDKKLKEFSPSFNKTYVSQVLNGKRDGISLKTFVKLLKELNISADYALQDVLELNNEEHFANVKKQKNQLDKIRFERFYNKCCSMKPEQFEAIEHLVDTLL